MSRDQNERNVAQVDAWIRGNAEGLAQVPLVSLFAHAIQAIQDRTVITLSNVTLAAILDRVLYQSQKRFPLLLGMKIQPEGISLEGVLSRAAFQDPAEIKEAFRFFLIELLTILGNLTAGILTNPLFHALSEVTAERIRAESGADGGEMALIKTSTHREDV